MKFEHLTVDLNHVLDEHMSQINLINRSVVFGVQDGECAYQNQPLSDLLAALQKEEEFSSLNDLERVDEIKTALSKMSAEICQKAAEKKLDSDKYLEFQTLSNEFMTRLWRFEKDFTKEGNGIDPITGLRSNSVIIEDLTRELSACARRGDYLGIAVGCIDSFISINKKLSKEEHEDVLVFVSNVLRKTMRLYDDGYRYKDDMFVLCFKHTDHLGAVSAIERFVRLIKEAHNTDEGKKINDLLGKDITLSYSVAKLEVGADVKDFLKELANDVKENADEASTILEYQDVSDLEKFVQGYNDKK